MNIAHELITETLSIAEQLVHKATDMKKQVFHYLTKLLVLSKTVK